MYTGLTQRPALCQNIENAALGEQINFFFIRGHETGGLRARSDEQGFFAKYLHAFVSGFFFNINVILNVCRY